MSRFYEEDELSKIKEIEKGILRDFLKICEENNLKYFGMGGTCLGAVRHGGYIPWDDDIDIGMPRRDYDKFIKIAEQQYSDKYYVLNADKYKNYPLMTTRWCVKGTKFVEESFVDLKEVPLGIFLDIFPYDNLANNKVERWFQQWGGWYYSKLMILRQISKPYLAQDGLIKKIILFICKMVHGAMCLLNIKPEKLHKRCKSICTRYNKTKTKKIGFIGDTSPHLEDDFIKDIFPCVKLKFDEFEMNFPKNLELHLTHLYGSDYMTPPPVEKRKTHFPNVLDFGDGSGERTSN